MTRRHRPELSLVTITWHASKPKLDFFLNLIKICFSVCHFVHLFVLIFETLLSFYKVCMTIEVVVAFSSLVRILGDHLTIHSPPALFFS